MALTSTDSKRETPDLVRYPWAANLPFLGENTEIAYRRVTQPSKFGNLPIIFIDGNRENLPIAQISRGNGSQCDSLKLGYLLGYSGVQDKFDLADIKRREDEINQRARAEGSTSYSSLSISDDSYNLFFVEGAIDVQLTGKREAFQCELERVSNVRFMNISRCLLLAPRDRTL